MILMKKASVSISQITDYQPDEIQKALETCLFNLGGIENLIKPQSNVFVKINHLSPPSPPEKAIVTHPLFTREVLRILKQLDVNITVGDDIYSKEEDGFQISGYRKICEEMEVHLLNLKEAGFREVRCQGELLEKVFISPSVLDADFILNLPKLKTHSFTVFTGAVKNMFGVIPHGYRHRYHREFIKNDVFSQMLVDIFACVPPHLTIMDGIVAMEGEGPSAGNPKNVGVIIASKDAVAVDAVALKITGTNPMNIYTTQNAHERGLGIGRIEEIDIKGKNIPDVEVRDFKHSTVAIGLFRRKLPSFLYATIQNQLTFIPEIIPKNCTACLECVNICPLDAARLEEDSVKIDKSLCIHCMCCHEVCRFQAVKLNQRPLGKIIRSLSFLYEKIVSLFT
jgi:uncharacterized protein (DUF362 family)/NAD-dependent dihydropyrimidine dehydrogenase PreA subunit